MLNERVADMAVASMGQYMNDSGVWAFTTDELSNFVTSIIKDVVWMAEQKKNEAIDLEMNVDEAMSVLVCDILDAYSIDD